MARGWLEAEGVRVRGLSRDEIATRALHSTSDFPAILAGVTNKTLRAAYDTAPRTYPAIARRTTVADFKLVHRLQLGEAPQLEKVNQSGEFKRGTIGEAQETYRIETFGKVIGITRQVLDQRRPRRLHPGAGALRHLGGDAGERRRLGHLHRQPGDGRRHDALPRQPQEPRRHRRGARRRRPRQGAHRHGAAARARRQDAAERPAAYLVVPSALELAAEQLLAQNIVPAKAADVVPSSIRSLAVIAEPRLDPASGAVPWFLVASPAAIDTIEYAYLEGQEGVALETRMGFDVDGVEVRARLDFGAKAIDWRGLYKNPGVALS